jgi:hypothetical protein
MLDETRKLLSQGTETAYAEVEKVISRMKSALDMIKRGIRHASLRAKPSNIITPYNFEREEIRMYSRKIKEIES